MFDIVLSSIALVVLFPLLLPIAIALRFTGEGDVFYLQDRVGKDGKLFKLYKFATMLRESPNIGTGTVTMREDPRVLPLGKYLRKTKINELPQLINIFLGDISVVGPRPQVQRCFDAFPADLQRVIVQVKPGLSGVGSIVFRAEEELLFGHAATLNFYDNVIAPYKGQVEAWYVEHQTILTYFAVIVVTAWVVVFPRSRLVWRVFNDLPAPPDALRQPLNYPE